MNLYGARARRHWEEFLPAGYAQIQQDQIEQGRDPEVYWVRLGEQIGARIEEETAAIAGPDRVGESYLDKVGRLTEARQTAEETVLRETLPEPESETDQDR